MNRSLLYMAIFTLTLAGPLQAQTLSPGFSELLEEQGFVVLSKRYTWLGRIVVNVSNGLYEREILISRGSNQILQDNWTRLEPGPAETGGGASPKILRDPRRGGADRGRPGGLAGPGGPAGPAGPGGPAGGPSGPGGPGG
ncbi:hypothetical protein [Hoeflea sp.]|uniref:hypothetical protein n=1 Tax=Hoeflea sp. TaxID=1940281 RepID=UPI003A91C059